MQKDLYFVMLHYLPVQKKGAEVNPLCLSSLKSK